MSSTTIVTRLRSRNLPSVFSWVSATLMIALWEQTSSRSVSRPRPRPSNSGVNRPQPTDAIPQPRGNPWTCVFRIFRRERPASVCIVTNAVRSRRLLESSIMQTLIAGHPIPIMPVALNRTGSEALELWVCLDRPSSWDNANEHGASLSEGRKGPRVPLRVAPDRWAARASGGARDA